jgi:hypothetical protein
MTPEEQAMLDQHVQAIAEILYREAESRPMETLGQIETVIRAQFQEHVGPQLGIFLSQKSPGQARATSAP